MDVGGDRVRRAAAGDRDFRHGEIEAAAAMADVEDHAALLGGERRRQQLAVLHDVGEDARHVRRSRNRQWVSTSPGRSRSRICDISSLVSTPPICTIILAGQPHISQAWMPRFERLEAVLEDDVLRHPHLDADQEIRIFGQRHGAGFDLRVVDVVELGDRERRQSVIGDMDEGVDPRPRLRHDVAAQRREIVDAGIARRDHRGGALELHQLVGGNADRRAVGIDVAMQVDQAGRHQLAGGVDGLQRARGGISGSIASITPQRMPMSRLPRSDWLGSSTSPPLITRSNLSFGPIAAPAGFEQTRHHGGGGRSRKRKKIAA